MRQVSSCLQCHSTRHSPGLCPRHIYSRSQDAKDTARGRASGTRLDRVPPYRDSNDHAARRSKLWRYIASLGLSNRDMSHSHWALAIWRLLLVGTTNHSRSDSSVVDHQQMEKRRHLPGELLSNERHDHQHLLSPTLLPSCARL